MNKPKMKQYWLAFLLMTTGVAEAHVVLEQKEAPAGSTYKAVLQVSHGCAGSATRQLTVTLPTGFLGAKPMPKAGWTLRVREAPLAQPYTAHGRQLTDDVVEISWTANSESNYIQNAWYDEFIVRGTLPDEAQELWFKVRQTCVAGEANWSEVPAPGESAKDLKSPAARLLVMPATPGAEHHH